MSGIRRKIGMVPPPAGRGAEGAWPLALTRGAEEGAGLALGVLRVTGSRAGLAEVLERLPPMSLMGLCAGPKGAGGLIALCPEVLAAVVERQTLGQVLPRPAAPRRPTRTDAAIAGGVIDGALTALEAALEEEADRIWAGGFRLSSVVEEVRALGLLLEEGDYRLLIAEVSLGGGAKAGTVLLALPAAGRGEPPKKAGAGAEAAAAMVWQAGLAEQVMGAEAALQAVLGRVTLTLAEVMALAPGEVLRLGGAALDRVDVEGGDGLRLAGGRLGQNRGMRAVRLSAAAEPAARGPGGLVPGLATAEAALRRAG